MLAVTPRLRARAAAALLPLCLSAPAGCGDDESDGSTSAGATGATGATGTGGTTATGTTGTGVDCSTVGCAPAPLCTEGCTEVCGCCPCAVGESARIDGEPHFCITSGCWVRGGGTGGAGGAGR